MSGLSFSPLKLRKHLKEFIESNLSLCTVIKVCPRECNRVADGLASHGCKLISTLSLSRLQRPCLLVFLVYITELQLRKINPQSVTFQHST